MQNKRLRCEQGLCSSSLAFQILHNKSEPLDFGEMPGGINRSRSLKLLNKGRAEVPLRLVLSGVSISFR